MPEDKGLAASFGGAPGAQREDSAAEASKAGVAPQEGAAEASKASVAPQDGAPMGSAVQESTPQEDTAEASNVSGAPQQNAPPHSAVLPYGNGWSLLHEALDEVERNALRLAAQGGDAAALKALADAQGMMLEVLADRINEKAADLMGDTILECDGALFIYEEYLDQIKDMVKA